MYLLFFRQSARESFGAQQSDDRYNMPLEWGLPDAGKTELGPRPRIEPKTIGDDALSTFPNVQLERLDHGSIFDEGPFRKRPAVL
jgi:hypothetical protein